MEGAFLFEAANHLGKPIRQGANPFALPHDRKFNATRRTAYLSTLLRHRRENLQEQHMQAKSSFWEIVARCLRIQSGNGTSTLSALAYRFPFPRDVERAESRLSDTKVYRPPSRASIETAAREYVATSNADLRNPFADYLADDAKVWSMYLDLTKSKGEELMRIWNCDLDTILIFAGLFSAILTAFLIKTRKDLQQDPQAITNNLIRDLIQTLSSETRQNSLLSTTFVPSSPLVWVNGLWFVSLTFALTGAFGTILAKGWVSQFIPVSAGLPIIDACNRHRRFFGDDQRHLRAVIHALPITLHIAFYLFFGGLVILLFQDDPRIGVVVTTLIAITMLLYLGCSIRPLLNPNSPFNTPISGLLPIIPGVFIPLILLADAIGHLVFTPRQRRRKARRVTSSYTHLDHVLLSTTKLRRTWTKGIFDTFSSLYHLMLVSNPPSDELRTDVLVGLFSLARTFKLDDPVCAIAGLPMSSRLQEALYIADPLRVLTRNITELLSSLDKTETSSDVTRAYLTVMLSLVQTTHSSLNWSASSLVAFLQPGGTLSNWDMFQDDILELIICIHIHVRIRSGFLIPAEFTNHIPEVISNCTNPLHRQWLIDASLILSAMDKGSTLKCLALNGAYCGFV
uniref:DUF6535 domain-containing protein n=2 Tax=Psilocybe cubensis TaxID=181762 RepID=A0A8H7XWI1_PSICU